MESKVASVQSQIAQRNKQLDEMNKKLQEYDQLVRQKSAQYLELEADLQSNEAEYYSKLK